MMTPNSNTDIRLLTGVTDELIRVKLGTRNRFRIERDATVRLVLTNDVAETETDIVVDENAQLFLYEIVDIPDAVRHSRLHIQQSENAHVTVAQATLQGKETLSDISIDLLAPGAQVTLAGLSIVDDERQATTRTHVRHLAPHCETFEIYKYILSDHANGVFDGLITVAPDAQKTVARQTNKNICLSPEAKMHAQPHLIINADDVVCNHGATVGQLDSDALFYMRQRGIPEAEARQLLLVAFLDDVESHFADALRQDLRSRIEERLMTR